MGALAKIGLSSREIVGFEALVSWRHPDQGIVTPGEFVPLAKETGLITQLGTSVIQAACRQNRSWRDAGLGNLRIAVNVSAAQFRDATLVGVITKALRESQLEPEEIEPKPPFGVCKSSHSPVEADVPRNHSGLSVAFSSRMSQRV